MTLGEQFVSDDKQTVVVSVESGLAALGVEVNYQLLRSAVQRFAGQTTLTASENQLIVESGRAQSKLPVRDKVSLAPPILGTGVDLPLADLKAMLKFAIPYVNPDAKDMQMHQSGVYLTRQVVAATDDWRCATLAWEGPEGLSQVLIPLGLAKAVMSLKGSTVTLHDLTNSLIFRSENTTIRGPKFSYAFPNVNSYVPKVYDVETDLDAKTTATALHSIAHALPPSSDITVTISEECITLFADCKSDPGTIPPTDTGTAGVEFEHSMIAPEPDPFEPVNFSYKFKARHRTLQDFFDSVEGNVRLSAAHVLILAAQNKKLMTRIIKV